MATRLWGAFSGSRPGEGSDDPKGHEARWREEFNGVADPNAQTLRQGIRQKDGGPVVRT